MSENVRPQSSQLAEPLWTNAGIKSEISVRELIFTLKKSAGEEKMVDDSPKTLAREDKVTHSTQNNSLWACRG